MVVPSGSPPKPAPFLGVPATLEGSESVPGSIGSNAIIRHEAGRVGIAGGNAGGGHRFTSPFASGDFHVKCQQLVQQVFLG